MPLAEVSVNVTGEPLRSVVEETVVPLPEVTVHVPPETESVAVGADPELPARIIVTVVLVPLEYPTVTVALRGEADDEVIEYGFVAGFTVTE